MRVLDVAATALRRLLRDRTSVFFLVLLPVLVIVIIGVTVRGQRPFRTGVVSGTASAEGRRITAALAASSAVELHSFDDLEAARTALRRSELDTIVVVPADADATIEAGRTVQVDVLGEQTDATSRAAAQAVSAVISDHAAALAAARARATVVRGNLARQLAAVAAVAQHTPPVEVRGRVVDAKSGILPGGFSYSTPTMLVLFVFITSIAGSAAMIESRRLGIHDRMLAGPVTPWTIVAGETLSYLLTAMLQSAIIVGVGALAFGVSWGDPVAAAALVAMWALVGTGAGVLAGALFRTPEQATAIGITGGMVAGMLGGCMWPLEIVGRTMRTVGHVTPQAWAVDGWVEILSRGGGITDIGRQLTVLAGFAAVLLTIAAFRLRARLTH